MKTTKFDISKYLDDPEMVSEYLNSVIEENDPKLFVLALGAIAKANGMTEMANRTGLGRESLYKALGGNRTPKVDTITKILDACGLTLGVRPKLITGSGKKRIA